MRATTARLVCAALVALLVTIPATAQNLPVVTAFVGATLIDGNGGKPVANAVVIVEGERISAVGRRYRLAIPDGARIVDLKGKWIIPGLIDAHVHFFQSGGLYTRPDIVDLRDVVPYADEIAAIGRDLPKTFARYLASGVTAVVDVGGPMSNFALRDRARETRLAPRVAVAGPLLATYAPPELASDDPAIVEMDSRRAARAEVRRQLARQPDLVKLWLVRTGGLDMPNVFQWARAAVEEAHAARVRVAAHATEREIARLAVRAGIDVLAHGVTDRTLDPALIDQIKAHGVVYMTTLMVDEGYYEVLGQAVQLSDIERRLGDPRAIASFAEVARHADRMPAWARGGPPANLHEVAFANLRSAAAAGVVVAAGSDAGNIGTLHGPALHRELELMVEAGLTPMQAIVAATRGGAAVMGRARDLGTIAPDKLADFVVLDADPLRDIRNTRRIDRVVKGGEVLDPAGIAAEAGID
ncbi:MAG: amidohydrolase family protein [Alphaproteobacteria bacterium]